VTKLAFGIERSNRRFRLRLARYRHLAGALSRAVPDGPSRILDAACGKGRVGLYWSHLAPADKAARLVGFDLSALRLTMARTRGYDLLLRADLLKAWPFPDGAFDVVVLEQVLEHFDDAQVARLLAEARRVLRPGGMALIGTPVFFRPALWISPFWRWFNPIYRRIRGSRWTPAHLQHFTVGEICERIRRSGFLIEEVRGFRLFSLPWNIFEDWEWYYRLHGRLGARFPGLSVEASIAARRIDGAAAGSEGP